jgi:poly(3-hydroxybutyrate) depolymerase
MDRCISYCLLLLFGATLNAQPINVRGTITNKEGKPVKNAVVSLVQQGLKDTTGEDGKYSFIKDTVAVLSPIIPQSERVTFKRGMLEFRATGTSTANIEFFNLNGNLLKKVSLKNTAPGIHRLNINDYFHSVNMIVIRASIGQYKTTFQYMPLQKGKYALSQSHHNKSTDKDLVLKVTTDIDSIKVKAEGYKEKVAVISSYDTTVDIALDTIEEGLCEGCGKTDYPKSGKYTIDVEGATREYILKIPNNYEPNKQYKLIFCIHAWGGDMNQIANQGYYGLEKLSQGSAIFVSPNGLEDNGQPRGWFNPNGRDIKFIKAMIKHFNSNLCIDQNRIFSTGFSFGGMMSYAIGCNMANVFRAIAPMSGAFISGCDSTDNKDPIAVWMAHGTSDEVVSLSSGKTALKHFIAKNGCSNETVPVNPSPCVAYQGCKEGYPVIYCEFNGGHAPQTWAQQATWDFFSQF